MVVFECVAAAHVVLANLSGDFRGFVFEEAVEVGFLLVEGLNLAFQLLLGGLQLLRLALHLFHFLVGFLLQLVGPLFHLLGGAVALVAGFLVFVLHLEELLLGLQDAFLLDDFGLLLGFFEQGDFFFDDGFLKQGGRDEITDREAHDQSSYGNDNHCCC